MLETIAHNFHILRDNGGSAGQQVVEEVLDAQGAGCPPEYHNIPIEKNHDYHKKSPHLDEMPFLRTRYDFTSGFSPNNPRQQVGREWPREMRREGKNDKVNFIGQVLGKADSEVWVRED